MINFIDNYTIDLSKIPDYDDFKTPFTVSFDKKICELLISGVDPNITNIMITKFTNNVYNYIEDDNKLTVVHNNRHNIGRFYSNNDKSPCCHTKFIKHTVFSYQNWLDIDMVKGHASIIRYVLKINGQQSSIFDDIVFNFDKKQKEIASYFQKICGVDLDEDNIKYFFNMTIYGGGYSTWINKLQDKADAEKYGYKVKVIPPGTPIHPFMAKFKMQCEKTMKIVYESNPEIVRRVCDANDTEYEKMCSTMSYFCGILENHIVYFVYKLILKNKGILPNECLPELDGICLPRLPGVDYDDIIEKINSALMPLEISFKIKPYGKFVLHDIINERKNMIEIPNEMPAQKLPKPIDIQVLKLGENNVAREISKSLKSTLVYSSERWVICDKHTNIWRYVKDPTATIITHIQNAIDESRKQLITMKQQCDDTKQKEKFDTIEKEYLKFYVEYGKNGVSSQVKKCLQEYLYEANFSEKLDNIKLKVAYKNGVLDLETLIFRHGILCSDFLTKTIPYDYEIAKEEDIDIVKEELKKICNYNDSHLEYYLSVLGYAMTGDSSKLQEFWALIGQKASNGKSVIFEVFTRIMPNYIIKLENDLFEKTYGSRHKEIATWGGARIAWVNEMTKKQQDAEFIKNLSDGTSVRYKVMYGEMDTMPISFKLFYVGNHSMRIDADNGIKRRMKVLQMDSDFMEDLEANDYENKLFIKDTSFCEKLATTYKHALLSLIFKYSKMFIDENKTKPYPNEWKEETKDVCADNNKFAIWFNDHFETGDGDDFKISKRELETELKFYYTGDFNIKDINIKDELKRMRIKFNYDSQKKLNGSKGVYFGFRRIDDEIQELNPDPTEKTDEMY
jgi:hypothetical protein